MHLRPRSWVVIGVGAATLCSLVTSSVSAQPRPLPSDLGDRTPPRSIARAAASVETTPTSHSGDSADDPAIWVDTEDPARSLVIGNDKQGDLETYTLLGRRHQQITGGTSFWGNVDVRQDVTVAGRTFDVVAAVNGGLRFFDVDSTTRQLSSVTDDSGVVKTGGGEGLCLYDSSTTGDLYAFVVARSGRVREYQVTDTDDDGLLEAKQVRQFRLGSEGEGCVADDQLGRAYFSQEDVALWRYGAEPDAGVARHAVDRVGPHGHLVSDIEGLTLGLAGPGGWLVASAQNVAHPRQSYFTVYSRRSNAYLGAFRVTAGAHADGCERTDGVAAYVGALGPRFPHGLFVCQDDNNRSPGVGNQDFKLVRWERVQGSLP